MSLRIFLIIIKFIYLSIFYLGLLRILAKYNFSRSVSVKVKSLSLPSRFINKLYYLKKKCLNSFHHPQQFSSREKAKENRECRSGEGGQAKRRAGGPSRATARGQGRQPSAQPREEGLPTRKLAGASESVISAPQSLVFSFRFLSFCTLEMQGLTGEAADGGEKLKSPQSGKKALKK